MSFRWGLPLAASTFAGDVDRGIRLIHVSMVTIFVAWAAVFVWMLFRYRARPGHQVEREGLSRWWLYVPLVLIFADEVNMIAAFGIPAWNRIKLSLPAPETSNVVELVAEQFAWSAHYPGPDGKFGRMDARFIDSANTLGLDPSDPDGKDDIVTINELRIPLGKPTLLYLSSKDVIHSFFVPEFRVKQDAVPGLRTPVWFEPLMNGKFEIACAQLCGIGHSKMRGDVIVDSPAGFQQWLGAQAKR